MQNLKQDEQTAHLKRKFIPFDRNVAHQEQNYFVDTGDVPAPLSLKKNMSKKLNEVEVLSVQSASMPSRGIPSKVDLNLVQQQINPAIHRKSSQSAVLFNGNRAINNFKNSIPELQISNNQQDLQGFEAHGDEESVLHNRDSPKSTPGCMTHSRSLKTSNKQNQDIPQIQGNFTDLIFEKDSMQSLSQRNENSQQSKAGDNGPCSFQPECSKNEKDKLIKQQKSPLYPPPEDIYRSKITVKHECVNFGLNMYFKKPHVFSGDPEQGGGAFAPNQACSSMPWGVIGCPQNKAENITDYVRKNIRSVVFCRYGMEYLKSFPRVDDLAIGSYRINLDNLIFQRQRHLDAESNASIVGMSFLKTKGQIQSPDKKGAGVGSGMILPFYKQLEGHDDQTLQFDSVFESGNLAIALKVSDNEYNCLLQNDINTNGHTQWFYFKVQSNFKRKTRVKINLINLYKGKSLYQYGMRILALDVSDKEKKELPKWQRAGEEICYIQNCYTNENSPGGLFQISFVYEFDKGYKEIYFAHSMPFTYSMLTNYLNQNVTKEKAKRVTLCHSLAGNKVEYLHITNKKKAQDGTEAGNTTARNKDTNSTFSPIKSQSPLKRQKSLTKKSKKQTQEPKIEKQVILLTSRVHPGETNASWMMQGLLDTILNPRGEEEEELVKNLKDHFEFYIIPMLNVDGVINGNYRCSLAACDLNRKWLKPSKTLHPSVYYTKKLCQNLLDTEKKQFFLYLDFHGHSAKKNIFQYGNRTDYWTPSKQKAYHFHQPSVFPHMVSKQFDYFNFNDCTYSMPKGKDSTARITMFHKLRIPFVFTLEASFAGANRGNLAGQHFSQGDFENVGKYVLKAIWEIKKLELNKSLLKQVTEEATKMAKTQNEDGDESEGCSSSEEDTELPTSSKKAMQIIQDQEASPKRVPESSTTKELITSAPASISMNQKRGLFHTNQPSPNKGAQKQNKSIINLKTITSGEQGVNSKHNSPRKNNNAYVTNKNPPERLHGGAIQPIRRSYRPTVSQPESQDFDEFSSQEMIQKSTDNESMRFDLIKNLIRAENPDDTPDSNIAPDSGSHQQELFEQFNAQIESSFAEQQHHLDEIFRQTAKQFLEQKNTPGGNWSQQSPTKKGSSKFVQENKGGQQQSQNWFLEQFLLQQKQMYQKDKLNQTQQKLFAQYDTQVPQQNQQASIQTFLQLQKLHQMQKLNQMAQMQFFRQQAELLLSQNLNQQQQWELFQQFSYYQAQIQMQNQQYQMMLSQSLHGNNMQVLKAQYAQQAAAALGAAASQVQPQDIKHKRFQSTHNPSASSGYGSDQIHRGNSPFKIQSPPTQFKKFFSTQDGQDRGLDELVDDYTPSDNQSNHVNFASSAKKQKYTRSSAVALNGVMSPVDPSDLDPLQLQGLEKHHPYLNSGPSINHDSELSRQRGEFQLPQASTTYNGQNQQTVLKLKKGLVEFKQPSQTNNLSMSTSTAEHQNFSQMLNQQLVDQGPMTQVQSPGQMPHVYQKKFFSTRGGRFSKHLLNKQNNKYLQYSELNNEHMQRMNQLSATAHNINTFAQTHVPINKPQSQNLSRGGNVPQQFWAHSNSSSLSSTQNYNNQPQVASGGLNRDSIFGQSEKQQAMRFAAEVDKMEQYIQQKSKQNSEFLHTENSVQPKTSNLFAKSREGSYTFVKGDIKKVNEAASTTQGYNNERPSRICRTEGLGSLQSPNRQIQTQGNTLYSNINSPSKKQNSMFEVQATIGKSRLNPVLQQQRVGYANAPNEQPVVRVQQHQPRVKQTTYGPPPGTAGDTLKSGSNTVFSHHIYPKPEAHQHLALNKSQDENVMKKHYNLQDDVDRHKGLIVTTAPISKNTRKTPSQCGHHYPPNQLMYQHHMRQRKEEGVEISQTQAKLQLRTQRHQDHVTSSKFLETNNEPLSGSAGDVHKQLQNQFGVSQNAAKGGNSNCFSPPGQPQ